MDDARNGLVPSTPPCRDPPALPPGQRGLATILLHMITAAEAKPLAPPEVPQELPQMSKLVRLHACLRLFLLDLEYELSPGGDLRGLSKAACRISLLLVFLSLCVACVLACIVPVVTIMAAISEQLVVIMWNMLIAALLLIALLVTAAGLLLTAQIFSNSSGSKRGGFGSNVRRSGRAW